MDPEMKEKIDETLKLTEENNKMLHKLKRSMLIGRIMRVVYWLFIIGAAFGAYYFLQPYIETLLGVYGGAKEDISNINSFFNR